MGSGRHIGLGCAHRGTLVAHVHARRSLFGLPERDVAGEDDDRNSRSRHGGLNGDLENARDLPGMRDHFAEVTAVGEQPFGMGFLEVSAAKLARWNVRGERQHRHATSMTVIQTVDQVQVTRPRTPGTDAQLSGEVRLGAGGKGARLLVPTCIHAMSSWLKIASVRPFRESPATP